MLNNPIYKGQYCWNRTQDVREPGTGKKIARPKPRSEWIFKDMPQLRIISDELWDRVKARQDSLTVTTGNWSKARPKSIVSGLMRCGVCDSPFVKHNQTRYACTRKGKCACTHRLSIRQDEIEKVIIEALQSKLMDERLVGVFCEEYTRHMSDLKKSGRATRAGYEAEIAKLERSRKRFMDAIEEGAPSKPFIAELNRIAERTEQLQDLLARCEEDKVLIHPSMARHYKKQVLRLTEGMNDEKLRGQAQEALRALIDKIVLTPNQEGTALVVNLFGDLAGILEIASAGERLASLPRRRRISAELNPLPQMVMVGGTGIEPVTPTMSR